MPMKARTYHTWAGEPVIGLDLGAHEYGRGAEAFRFLGGRWHEVSPIDLMFKAAEITETHFGLRYPTACAARRWLPRTEATPDSEEVRLDNILKTLEELKAKRLAQEGPPDQPPEAAA
jgi:hypothetical protein